MNRLNLCLLLMIALIAPGVLMSQDAGVVYLEGFPSLRSRGINRDLDFGLAVRPGDSVLTGRRDYVELDQAGNSIRINADTVFTLREIERDGVRETVMTNTLGSVVYRFQTLFGRRQQVGTATAVAGVRGTEFTVYAGSDGSSLFAVESGLIEVESAGVTVQVGADQGVTVPPGEPPGEVFERLGRPIDHSEWDAQRFEAFLADPVGGIARLTNRLRDYVADMERMRSLFEASNEQYQAARQELRRLNESGDVRATQRYRQEVVFPLMANTGNLYLNARYYAVSALSLRRFVLSRTYTAVKIQYLFDTDNPSFSRFEAGYRDFLVLFEQRIVPMLEAHDI